MTDKILQSKINGGFIQHATTDFEVRRTNLCWDIKEFGCTIGSADALQFDKRVSLIEHSCECDLRLDTDTKEPHEKLPDYRKSLLKIELYSYRGKGAWLLVSVILRDSSQDERIISEKQSWDLTNSDRIVLNFPLPPKKNKPHHYSSGFTFLSDFAYNGTLTIHVLFEEVIELKRIKDQIINLNEITAIDPENFAEFYRKQMLVDVVFIFPNNKLLHAHAIVLASVSPYFSAMFTTSNMREQKTRQVNLSNDKDVNFDIFKGFLDYVYGVRKLKEMDNIIGGLSILADKYNISKLHQECESMLCNSLQKSKLASLLILAHKYHFRFLKQKILDSAKTHGIAAFKELDEFKELCQNSELLNELLSSL